MVVALMSMFSYHLGVFHEIWAKDASYLSFATLALFYGMSVWCGVKTFRVCTWNGCCSGRLVHFRNQEEIGWFASELCLTLGMLGTIVGFVMMLAGFETLDISKVDTVQRLLSELGLSMATALYTTLVGLICGSLLKVQYFNLGQAIKCNEDKLNSESKKCHRKERNEN